MIMTILYYAIIKSAQVGFSFYKQRETHTQRQRQTETEIDRETETE